MGAVQETFVNTVLATHAGENCLIWPFAKNGNGYGFLYTNSHRKLAHRVACEIANGPAPSPKHEAAHTCGCGHLGCVSPAHLKWKTRRENALDAITHGTASRGERHGCAVLTEEDVHLIRALRGRIGQRVLAAHFGVSHSTIGHIHTRRLWRWLPDTLEDLEREASDLAARIQAKKAGRIGR